MLATNLKIRKTNIKKLEDKCKGFETKVKNLGTQNQDLEAKVDDLEARGLRENLLFHGIGEMANENCVTLVRISYETNWVSKKK